MGLDAIIDVGKLRENAEKIRNAASGKRLTFMVKADGYNHGAAVVAALTADLADDFGVATAAEASALKRAGIGVPVTVYSPSPEDIAAVIGNGSVPVVHSAECMEALKGFPGAVVDVKIDTTMNRFGFRGETAVVDAAVAARNIGLKVRTLLTHIPDPGAAAESIAVFNARKSAFEKYYGQKLPGEYAASDGMLHAVGGDGYRIGRLLYEGAMKVYGTVLAKGALKKGERAGYNGVYTATGDTLTAVVSGGYYDGIRRDYRGAKVLYDGTPVTVAAVCMDVTILADVPERMKTGDRVLMFDGRSPIGNGDANIYETMTSFKGRIKRKYLSDGKIFTEEDYKTAFLPSV